MDFDRLPEFTAFILERENIRKLRAAGAPFPWTKDPILANYRFTNVRREDDATTIWIARNWRTPMVGHVNLVLSMALARFLNNIETLSYIGMPEDWDEEVYAFNLKTWRSGGRRVFNPAYIVSTNGVQMDKVDYVCQLVSRVGVVQGQIHKGMTLQSAANTLLSVRGIGHFMAGQIIADLKHTPLLSGASDFRSWCAPGPGSIRGMNYLMGAISTSHWGAFAFNEAVQRLQKRLPVELADLSAQDVQNCLCEFSKYMKTVLGKGTPKQGYLPKEL